MAARWSYSFQASDPTGDRLREHAERSEGDRDCARSEWCASATRERLDDGTTERTPAKTYRAFCDKDEAIIGQCLTALPATYARLALAIGDHVTGEIMVRVPFGPSVPLRCDVDEVMRLIIDAVLSWHERVAAVARLSLPDTQAWRTRSLGPYAAGLLAASVPVLAGHLTTLLGLERDVMLRPCSPAVTRFAQVLSNGADTALVLASGAEAGNELLQLDYLGRAALGETNPDLDRLLGIQCPGCGHLSLRRAEPPQHDGDTVYFARCGDCQHLLTSPEYDWWLRRLTGFYRHRITPAIAASAGYRSVEAALSAADRVTPAMAATG